MATTYSDDDFNASTQSAGATYSKFPPPTECPPKLRYKKVAFIRIPQHVRWLADVKACADQNPDFNPGDTAIPPGEQKQDKTKKPIPWIWVAGGAALLVFGGFLGGVKG